MKVVYEKRYGYEWGVDTFNKTERKEIDIPKNEKWYYYFNIVLADANKVLNELKYKINKETGFIGNITNFRIKNAIKNILSLMSIPRRYRYFYSTYLGNTYLPYQEREDYHLHMEFDVLYEKNLRYETIHCTNFKFIYERDVISNRDKSEKMIVEFLPPSYYDPDGVCTLKIEIIKPLKFNREIIITFLTDKSEKILEKFIEFINKLRSFDSLNNITYDDIIRVQEEIHDWIISFIQL